ncbi:NUAK family SNF1-like kinase 1 [Oncorhynchus tshawytscha]|uniref:non-specific serine/threonine protein kinase n=1 Tax=Oncorhynchus tshawytscha TaxID=74940 RepID=A0A8C8C5T9_ONCTS|nr:NUAK family SNF1-like kinase 1 [Oncorhynchus tshawytscha]
MGRREIRRDHRSSVMSTEDRSERRENMQDTADTETGDDGSETSSLDSRRLLSGDKRRSHTGETGSMPVEVKKHQHKHNLKHRYEVMETLGKGTYGKVKRAMERTTRKTVAIKSIRKESITDDLDRVHIKREIEITSALKHPYIIRFHEVFESRDKIVIVMEYASRGELYDYVNERRRLVETEARDIFRQITSAVHYCHTNGVVHRDLKLENILLDQDLNVKLADFGLSNRFKKDNLLQTYCGSPLYASPEIVKGLPYHGPEVDCWAMGVLLYALVYGSMPFDGASYRALTEQISQGRYRRPNPPSDACALIDWLLTVRVEERATVEDIANHWWVNWGYEDSVCDCPSSPHQDCPSPLLARYIDWQNRVATATSCPSSDPSAHPHPFYFSFPLKGDRGGGVRSRGERSSLRKSRKVNTIPQNALGACSPVCTTTAINTTTTTAASISSSSIGQVERKKPKGILKPQRSFDSTFLPPPRVMGENSSAKPCNLPPQPHRAHTHTHSHSDGLSTSLPAPSMFSHSSSKMPKKGILKNLYGGESGYCSSPERGMSGAGTGVGGRGVDGDMCCSYDPHSPSPSSEHSPTMRTEAVRRRKGILKRNGKFSHSLDLPDALHPSLSSALAHFPEALHQLHQASGGSRPPSVVSEDSLLSSDSFDLLDLSTQSRRRIFSRGTQSSACSSEEELEDPVARAADGIGLGRGRGREEEDEMSLEERQEMLR